MYTFDVGRIVCVSPTGPLPYPILPVPVAAGISRGPIRGRRVLQARALGVRGTSGRELCQAEGGDRCVRGRVGGAGCARGGLLLVGKVSGHVSYSYPMRRAV